MTVRPRRRRPPDWKLRELAAEVAARRHLEALGLGHDPAAQLRDFGRRAEQLYLDATQSQEVPF